MDREEHQDTFFLDAAQGQAAQSQQNVVCILYPLTTVPLYIARPDSFRFESDGRYHIASVR